MNNLCIRTATGGWAKVENKTKPSVLLQDVKCEVYSAAGLCANSTPDAVLIDIFLRNFGKYGRFVRSVRTGFFSCFPLGQSLSPFVGCRIPARIATEMVWCVHAFTIEAFFFRLRWAVGPFNFKELCIIHPCPTVRLFSARGGTVEGHSFFVRVGGVKQRRQC